MATEWTTSLSRTSSDKLAHVLTDFLKCLGRCKDTNKLSTGATNALDMFITSVWEHTSIGPCKAICRPPTCQCGPPMS